MSSLKAPPKQRGEDVKSNHRQFWTYPFLLLAGVIVLFIFSQTVAVLVSGFFARSIDSPYRILLIQAICLLIVATLLSIIFQFSGYSWKSLGIKNTALKNYLLIIPISVVYLMIGSILLAVAIKFLPGFDVKEAQEVGMKTVVSWRQLLAGFVALVVLTPIVEELVFRGILFRGLNKRMAFWLAALITSLLFAAVHGQWNVGIDTFVMSLASCYLVKKSDSIYPSMILHALKNSVAFVALFAIPFLR